MSTRTAESLPIPALREALRDWARKVDKSQTLPAEQQRAKDRLDLAYALNRQGVDLTHDELDVTYMVIRKRLFMGGNYTLDAKAIVKAILSGDDAETVRYKA